MEQKGDCKNDSANKILDSKKTNVVLFHPKFWISFESEISLETKSLESSSGDQMKIN